MLKLVLPGISNEIPKRQYRDFGVNRERIDAWLKTLREGL
jgi:hypothetical protein